MSHIFVLSFVSVGIFFAAISAFFFLSEEHSPPSPPIPSHPMMHLHPSSVLSSPHSPRRRMGASSRATAVMASNATIFAMAMAQNPNPM